MFFDDVPLPHRLTITALRTRIRKQPHELLWRVFLLGRFGRFDVRHRKLRLESLIALLRNGEDGADMTSLALHFASWRWAEAQQVIAGLSVLAPAERNWATAQFLALISGSSDESQLGLAVARQALDRVPLKLRRREPGDWVYLEGLVLAQQDPPAFLRRFTELVGVLQSEPLVGHRLCDWAVGAEPGGVVDRRLRLALDSLPAHLRDPHGEVRLALRDARRAMTSKRRASLHEAVRRLEHFTPGAKFLHPEVLALARELVHSGQLRSVSQRLLTRLLPTHEGPAARVLLRRLARAR